MTRARVVGTAPPRRLYEFSKTCGAFAASPVMWSARLPLLPPARGCSRSDAVNAKLLDDIIRLPYRIHGPFHTIQRKARVRRSRDRAYEALRDTAGDTAGVQQSAGRFGGTARSSVHRLSAFVGIDMRMNERRALL
ncbi:hypothetical protein LSCM4_05961 [Leishmania orientalis]|uniref:Uncharacterized protein n=1 Tax=Leishmania orientalis TaxID=2249476 RepID=A0A836H1S3_9TRYP|nr:hypothetical protein LSCM4_05961 [Leishmania orientalis]